MTTPNVVSLPTHPTRCVDENALSILVHILDDGSASPAIVKRAARTGVHAMHFGERQHGCETAMQAWRRMRRDPDIAAVLDEVRRSGMSAHGSGAYPVSGPVELIARRRSLRADELQHRVDLYGHTLDAATRAASVIR